MPPNVTRPPCPMRSRTTSSGVQHRTQAMTAREFDQFRTLVYRHTHIACPDAHQALFERKIRSCLREVGLHAFQDYYALLTASEGADAELRRLIDVVAVHETAFFRIPGHFQGLRAQVFPQLLRRGHAPVTIWSAGCSSGEEAYSIAIAWLETLQTPQAADIHPQRLRILATDISPAMIAAARAGRYAAQKVRNIPQAFLDKYFELHDNQYIIRPAAKALIQFEVFNLATMPPPLTQADIIFCRNLFIYFDRPAQLRLMMNLATLLNTGGYLFLGDAESLHPFDQVARMFEILPAENAIFYQKQEVQSS